MRRKSICPCGCAGTVCTKWTIHHNNIDPVNMQNYSDAGIYYSNSYGPNSRIKHDAEFCRQQLDFAYDEDLFEMSVAIRTPPHIDCGASGTDVCQRRISQSLNGWVGSGAQGFATVGMSKVIKLRQGQRVRVRLVSDAVASASNYHGTDIFWLWGSSYDINGNYVVLGSPAQSFYTQYNSAGLKFGPIVTLTPASTGVWDEKKACKITSYPLNQEKWYAAGVWPYDDTDEWTRFNGTYIPDGTGYNDIDRSAATRTYGHIEDFYNPHTCYMPAEAGVPPEIHPAAPNVDIHPALYTKSFGYGMYQNNMPLWPYYSPPAWVKVANVWIRPEPGQQSEGNANTIDTSLQNWFACQYMAWPDAASWEDIATLFGNESAGGYRNSFFSAPESYMTQPDDTNPSGVPVTAPPFKTYMLCVPSVTCGYSQESGGGRQMLRPDETTDNAHVEAQRVAWEETFENVTFHELTMPSHVVRSTARPRVVLPNWKDMHQYALQYTPAFPKDNAGMSGLQNGCFNPGVCDIEMVIDIDRTGPWVMKIVDSGNPLTYGGSTSVVTFLIEEPDPDNEGEWRAFDAREACKPEITPDHTGWFIPTTYTNFLSEYIGPFKQFGIGSYGTHGARVDQAVPCDEPAGNNVTGKYVSHLTQDTDTWIDANIAGTEVIQNGAHFIDFRTQSQYYEDAWAVIRGYVLNMYYEHTRFAVCCGYETTKYPILASSCHHHNNWAEIQGTYQNYNNVTIYTYRMLYGYNPAPYAIYPKWILPW